MYRISATLRTSCTTYLFYSLVDTFLGRGEGQLCAEFTFVPDSNALSHSVLNLFI